MTPFSATWVWSMIDLLSAFSSAALGRKPGTADRSGRVSGLEGGLDADGGGVAAVFADEGPGAVIDRPGAPVGGDAGGVRRIPVDAQQPGVGFPPGRVVAVVGGVIAADDFDRAVTIAAQRLQHLGTRPGAGTGRKGRLLAGDG